MSDHEWVRFYFDDADPVAECECGWHAHGDAAVDAFRAWWKHRAAVGELDDAPALCRHGYLPAESPCSEHAGAPDAGA